MMHETPKDASKARHVFTTPDWTTDNTATEKAVSVDCELAVLWIGV